MIFVIFNILICIAAAYNSQKMHHGNAVFARYPSYHQLNEILLRSPSHALNQLLQQLHADESMACRDKLLYQNQILALIKNVLHLKRNLLTQHEPFNYMEMYKKVNEESQVLQTKAKELGLYQINEEIQQAKHQLYNNEDYKTDLKKAKTSVEEKISTHRDAINQYTKNSMEERKSIQGQKLKLIKINLEIERAEDLLHALKKQKQQSNQKVRNSYQIINRNNIKIHQARETIHELEEKVEAIVDQLFGLKSDAINLKVDIELLQHQAPNEGDTLLYNINQHHSLKHTLLEKHRSKVLLLQHIHLLSTRLVTMQLEISSHHSSCFEVEDYSGQGFIMEGPYLSTYLYSLYGDKVSLPAKQCLVRDAFTQVDREVFRVEQFSCLREDNVISGSGIVAKVHREGIEVEDGRGRIVVLKIGRCSRVEATNGQIDAGKVIYYRGFRREGLIDAYFVTCF